MTQTATQSGLKAVEKAVHEHHALVYRLAHRMLRNPADAEDVTQCVFLLLLRSLDSFRKARSSRAWLARITINQAVSWMRAEGRRRKREKGWATDPTRLRMMGNDMNNDSLRDNAPDPGALKTAIRALPEELRVPLILHYQEGFKYREIAEACKCPEGTVAKRISTAKARIKRHLGSAGVVAGVLGLEGALRAEAPITPPSGLAERLIDGAARELARLGATACASGASVSIGKTLLAKLSVALSCAVLVMTGAWYGVDWTLESRRTPKPVEVAAAPESLPRAARRAQPRSSSKAKRHNLAADPASAVDASSDDASAAELEPGHGPRVQGWVRDKDGQPVAGARVMFAPSASATPAGSPVITDESGHYELDWQAANAATQVDFTMQKVPLMDGLFAEVSATDDASRRDAARASYDVVQSLAWSFEEKLEESQLIYSQEIARATDLLNLETQVLKPESAIRVALAEQAKAVESVSKGLKVLAMENEHIVRWRGDALHCNSCHENAAGKDLQATDKSTASSPPCAARGQSVLVRAELEGFEPALSESIDLQASELVEVNLVLRDAKPISGLVATDRGVPVADTEVAIVAYSGDQRFPSSSLVVRTSEDGSFVFASLGDGHFLLRAQADGFLSRDVVARAGGPAARITLSPAGRVLAQVVDGETSQPLAGYKVELHDAIGVVAEAVTDSTGSALLHGLAAGAFVLNTYKEGSSSQYSRATQEVTVTAGKEASARLTVYSRADVIGSVSGVGYDGIAGDAVVQIVPLKAMKRASAERKSSQVLADGSFAIKNIPPGRYALILGRKISDENVEAWTAQELEIRPGQQQAQTEIRLDAASPGIVTIDVVDAAGRPVPDASVGLELDGLETRLGQRSTDGDGHAEFQTRPGRLSISVEAHGFEAASVGDIELRGGGHEMIRVALRAEEASPAPALSIAEIFTQRDPITLERPLSLRDFRDLSQSLGWTPLSISPELEQSGAADRIRVDRPGPRAPSALLDELIRSGSLAWQLARGGISCYRLTGR